MKEERSEKALIIISKAPKAEYSKTRLELPAEMKELFCVLCIKSTIEKCSRLRDTDLVFAYYPSTEGTAMKEICGDSVTLFSPNKADFGEALVDSYLHCFSSGYSVVGNIAPDSPDTPLGYISQGLELPSVRDVAIGPTFDGGYYLLSMRSASTVEVFSGVDWGTEKVFRQLVSNARRHKLELQVLPMWYDVDNIRDIIVLKNHLNALEIAGQLESYSQDLMMFLNERP